jgi:hypothetical protein
MDKRELYAKRVAHIKEAVSQEKWDRFFLGESVDEYFINHYWDYERDGDSLYYRLCGDLDVIPKEFEQAVMEKEYDGFESLNDLIEDVSESHGALFTGMDKLKIGGEFQGKLKVVVTYEEE